MMKLPLLLILLLCSIDAYSQHGYVTWHPTQVLTLKHTVKAGETLFGIAQMYGKSIGQVKTINKLEKNEGLDIDQQLFIPIDAEQIVMSPATSHLAIYYEVQPAQTLYHISTIYAQKTVAEIMSLNGKSDYHIVPGDQLLMGYLTLPKSIDKSIEQAEEEEFDELIVNFKEDHDPTSHTIFDTMINDSSYHHSLKIHKGIAYWDKSDAQSADYVVMHSKAKVNSDIVLYNPMLQRQVKAKVVSALPKNLYPSNIDVVISPLVASALGARDRRFLVEMTYVE